MLQVDGTLQLYTTLFGWQLYATVWELLLASGLVWLPILGVVIDQISEVRSRGSLMSNNAESAFAGLELQLVFMLIVVLIGAIPRVSLNPGNIRFADRPDIFNGTLTERTIGSTDSRADTTNQATIDTSESVQVPLWWYGVMQFSNGFRYAVENTMDAYGGAYRQLRTAGNVAAIRNPDLKRKVDEFYTECYLPALSDYRRANTDPNLSVALIGEDPDTGESGEGPDVTWIGSSEFVGGYYATHRMPYIVAGFPYDPDYDTGYETNPGAGAPLCSDYWAEIEDDIFEESGRTGFKDWLIAAAPLLETPLNATTWLDTNKSEIARVFLANSRPEFSNTANRMVALRTGGDGWVIDRARDAAGLLEIYQYAKIAIMIELGIDVLLYALQAGQAYLLFVIYMSLPFALLLGRYSFGTLMGGALLIFAVNFFSVLWSAVAFIDNWLFAQIWSDQNYLGQIFRLDFDGIKQRLVHSITTASLYLTATLGFGYVLLVGGSRLGFALGSGVNPGGFGSAAGPQVGGGISALRSAGAGVNGARGVNSFSKWKSARAEAKVGIHR